MIIFKKGGKTNMKMKNIIVGLAAGFLALGGALTAKLNEQKEVIVAKADDFNPANAHIRGGARMSYVAPTDSNTGWTYVHQVMMNQASSGGGIYIRMRNYTGTITPIDVQICDNGDGGGLCWTVGTANLHYYLYDNQGKNEVECTYLYTTMIQLPVYFDGIVYLPYANYTNNAWGGTQRTSMNTSAIWRITFGLQPQYNGFANFTIGDAYTAEHINFDATQLTTQALFDQHFPTENYAGDGQIIASQELFTDFDPSNKDLLGGCMIKTTSSTNYQGPVADIASMERSIYGGGFFMRVRNYTGDIWGMLQVMGCESSNCMPKENEPFYYYNLQGVQTGIIAANPYNGFCIPANFDGFIYVPLSSLYNAAAGTPERYDWIWGIFLTVDAQSFPDRVVVIGDLFSFADFLRDCSTTTHATFASLRNTNQFGKVCHYPGFSGEKATRWAEKFLQDSYPCNEEAANVWDDYADEYDALAAEDQAILQEAVYAGLTDSQKNVVEQAMERYDLAVARQSLINFISRASIASNTTNLLKIDNTSTIVIAVICATIVSLSVAAFFFMRNRRKQEQ